MIEWTDDLTVWNETIDADHKAFITVVGLLHEAWGEHESTVIMSAISFLEDFAGGHFLREERLLRDARCPNLEAHLRDHAQFRRRLALLAAAYRGGEETAARGLARLAASWLTGHIRLVDIQLRGCVGHATVDGRPLGVLALEAAAILRESEP